MGGLPESMSVNHAHAVSESEARQGYRIWISYETVSYKPQWVLGVELEEQQAPLTTEPSL